MLSTDNISLGFGERVLFKEVNLKFTAGNCYGIIGANGCGKSSFLKILSKEMEQTTGTISIEKNKRLAVLKQNQFEFDEYPVIETVLRGHKRLFSIMKEKDEIYAKPDFSDADGMRVADLESEFSELNGWEAESEASKLLSDLGLKESMHTLLMKELSGSEKVKVLLAQALFGNPDILIMDEPTNNLDVKTVLWLENFLCDFQNTVLIVSHDRHFLDNVCTHIVDIDYSQMKLYTGNYSFWRDASQLASQQKKDSNKRIEAKREELLTFIQRFSANASKAKQATSRKNLLSKLTVEDIEPSSRRYPHIFFKPNRENGDKVLNITNLSKAKAGTVLFKDFSLEAKKGEKIAFIGNGLSITSLFEIISGEDTADSGKCEWGITSSYSFFPKENSKYFENDLNLIDWLRQFALDPKDENFIRGFLGKMLFSGDDTLKKCKVLSGGEKARCMFSRMMLLAPNVLVLDEPTNHLDLESITALNNGLMDCNCVVLFSSHDYQFIQALLTAK